MGKEAKVGLCECSWCKEYDAIRLLFFKNKNRNFIKQARNCAFDGKHLMLQPPYATFTSQIFFTSIDHYFKASILLLE